LFPIALGPPLPRNWGTIRWGTNQAPPHPTPARPCPEPVPARRGLLGCILFNAPPFIRVHPYPSAAKNARFPREIRTSPQFRAEWFIAPSKNPLFFSPKYLQNRPTPQKTKSRVYRPYATRHQTPDTALPDSQQRTTDNGPRTALRISGKARIGPAVPIGSGPRYASPERGGQPTACAVYRSTQA
jgi:hypothetical protein